MVIMIANVHPNRADSPRIPEASTGGLQLTAEQLLQHQEELREAGGVDVVGGGQRKGFQRAESMLYKHISYVYIYIRICMIVNDNWG